MQGLAFVLNQPHLFLFLFRSFLLYSLFAKHESGTSDQESDNDEDVEEVIEL